MLTRVVLILIGCLCSIAGAVEQRPHVFVIQVLPSNTAVVGETKPTPPDGIDFDKVLSKNWQSSRGTYLASPGRSATQTALLFGTPPLQQGVISDSDWRRKPIAASTLADRFRKVGYQTRFYGAWALGSTAPYDPKSRGFNQASYFEAANRDTLADSWMLGKAPPKWNFENADPDVPVFAVIAEGRHLKRATILHRLHAWLEKNQGPALVMIAETDITFTSRYHNPGKWYCYTTGDHQKPNRITADWDINRAIHQMLGWEVMAKPDVTIFHKASWPRNESPEKYRYRGSLVLGNGLALVDGLRLYPAKNYLPDDNREMDISEHPKEHQALLTANTQWWLKASRAIHDPRAFDVGRKDNHASKLTAQDWRISKIIGPDDKSPLSDPMIEQGKLLAILDGLKTNAEYKATFPAYSGSWSVNITRPGRYKITASLLPKDIENPAHKELMKLQGGTAHIKLGRNEVQLRLHKGATSVSVQTDADAGVTDLECWFTGQLALVRELGAFYVEIERIGDKKFDLNAKPTSLPTGDKPKK